ncbi:Yme2p [Sugiyamaella lignohabitans]|uniref:Mitochondrial escape protein 2 n=1 Tax=Sugiyamaella lignohabitans TaxID=796027 RepID=A0A167E3H7_9ASCO|nr:Yme2p [Sugiyamaella lignohabitans]ANB13592.1 Yme2p [Sugiyamaella lignohabitans]
MSIAMRYLVSGAGLCRIARTSSCRVMTTITDARTPGTRLQQRHLMFTRLYATDPKLEQKKGTAEKSGTATSADNSDGVVESNETKADKAAEKDVDQAPVSDDVAGGATNSRPTTSSGSPIPDPTAPEDITNPLATVKVSPGSPDTNENPTKATGETTKAVESGIAGVAPATDANSDDGSDSVKAEPLTEDQENPEQTTGVIEKDSHQGIIYYDRMYPSITRLVYVRKFLIQFTYLGNKTKLADTIKKISFPEDLPLEIINLIPRERDGGVFVTYQIDKSSVDVKTAEKAIYEKLEKAKYTPWFAPFTPVRGFPVKGSPWIEDLRRFTSNQLKATFEGPDLSQETLYSLLRRYGPIIDIVPPAPGTKDLPRSAKVIFSKYIDAATARNCITGIKVDDTRLHISFESVDHKNIVKDFVLNHTRIVVPILIAIVAGLAVMIFEPIRVWCIERHIHGSSLQLEKLRGVFGFDKLFALWDFIASGGRRRFSLFKRTPTDTGVSHLWDDRVKSIEDLKQWLREGQCTFIVVSGPRGGGKEQLVLEHAVKDHDNVLTIDCDNLVRVRGDSAFVKAAANEICYHPVFPWKNSLANYLDVISQGLSGQKTGFAESTEAQFKDMLSSAAIALQKVALHDHDPNMDSAENYLQIHPEKKPVVVINHFLSRYEATNPFVYKLIADWCAQLIRANVAHVIFITSDVSYEKVLSPALPNQVFKSLFVGDASADSARSFVLRQIEVANKDNSKDDENSDTQEKDGKEKQQKVTINEIQELDEALEPLGGRLTDLQAFARRLKTGDTPDVALRDMINQSATEVLQMYLNKESSEWTSEQVWVLIKKFAEYEDEVPLGVLRQDPCFKTADNLKAISALEHNEMISAHTVGGRIVSLRPGKPLYTAAFQLLAKDKSLEALMETNILNTAVSKEESNINKYETELALLSKLPSRWEIKGRVNYLSAKLLISQKNIEDFEKKLAAFKGVIVQERSKN